MYGPMVFSHFRTLTLWYRLQKSLAAPLSGNFLAIPFLGCRQTNRLKLLAALNCREDRSCLAESCSANSCSAKSGTLPVTQGRLWFGKFASTRVLCEARGGVVTSKGKPGKEFAGAEWVLCNLIPPGYLQGVTGVIGERSIVRRWD
jgi:hypothetical protein